MKFLNPSLRIPRKFVVGLITLGVVGIFLFQNCGKTGFVNSETIESASTNKVKGNSSPDGSCAEGIVSWNVGSRACSGTYKSLQNHGAAQVQDTSGNFQGTASIACDDSKISVQNQGSICTEMTPGTNLPVATTPACGVVVFSSANMPTSNFCVAGSVMSGLSGSGPWAWTCTSALGSIGCRADKKQIDQTVTTTMPTTRPSISTPCSTTEVKQGNRICSIPINQSKMVCSDICQPETCNTGYALDFYASRCVPLEVGSCDLPAATLHLYPSSTVPAWQCLVNTRAQSLAVNQSVPYSCQIPGLTMRTEISCLLEQVTDHPMNNGGAPYGVKKLHYTRGFPNDGYLGLPTHFYLVLSSSKTVEFDLNSFAANAHLNIGENNSAWTNWCSPIPIHNTTFSNFRISGNVSQTVDPSPGKEYTRCATGSDGSPLIVKVKCNPRPSQYTPNIGNWDVVSTVAANLSDTGDYCMVRMSNGQSDASKTSQVDQWVSPY